MQRPIPDLLWENDEEAVGCYFIPGFLDCTTNLPISDNSPKENVYFESELEKLSIRTLLTQIERTFNLKVFGRLKRIERVGGFRFALHFASNEFLERHADKYLIKWSAGDREILLSFDDSADFADFDVDGTKVFYGDTLITAEDKKIIGDIIQSIGFLSESVLKNREFSAKIAHLEKQVKVYEKEMRQ
jgi:hypothetical protein